jgi:hypothetical protein
MTAAIAPRSWPLDKRGALRTCAPGATVHKANRDMRWLRCRPPMLRISSGVCWEDLIIYLKSSAMISF